MSKAKYSKNKYTPRVYIGDVLVDGGWMTSQQIADKLSESRRHRRLLNGPQGISNLLRGAEGVEKDQSGRRVRYRMQSHPAYMVWARGEKHLKEGKWHGRV